MKLHSPFIIGSALMPCLPIADGFLSLLAVDRCKHESSLGYRWRATMEFRAPGVQCVDDSLISGVGGFKSHVDIFEAYLSFLSADIESYQENPAVPSPLLRWAIEKQEAIEEAVCGLFTEDGVVNAALIEA